MRRAAQKWRNVVRSVALLSWLPGGGCILGDDTCGPHQVPAGDFHELCVCEPNWVIRPNGKGCVQCAANEVAVGGVCVCEAGFIKANAAAECEASLAGGACESDATCPPSFPYCQRENAADGYCTVRDCADNAGCPVGWSCEKDDGGSVCKTAPTGIGMSCQSSADCAAFDAQYCDVFQSHMCLLSGCASGGAQCPNAWGCCDYSALFGSPLSLCVQPDALSAGACPQGGTLVTR